MSEIVIEHGCARAREPYLPIACTIVEIKQQSQDVKSFKLQAEDGGRPFDSEPGQTAMVSLPPYGEVMIAITSQGEDCLEFAIKKVGFVTERIHQLGVGAHVGLRGPFGNWFPYESCKGRNLLFIAGGIGVAPVRSFIMYVMEHRGDYGRVDIVTSGSSVEDLTFRDDLESWAQVPDTHVFTNIYHAEDGWDGYVGYTATYIQELFESEGWSTDNVAVTLCGGPSLFRTCREALAEKGYRPEDIITTLEMRMKCGVGKCGRCNIGGLFICLDGPVFTEAELADIPRDV